MRQSSAVQPERRALAATCGLIGRVRSRIPHVAALRKDLRLLVMLSTRDLRNRFASSYAGFAWNIGVPLVYAIINVAVFSVLMTGRMGERYADVPFALFYFVPLSLWAFFSDMAIRSTSILREYSYLINKIAFPLWVLPLVPAASALLNQMILFGLAIGLMAYHEILPATSTPYFLLVWLFCIFFSIGMAYTVSSLSAYIPDVTQITPMVLNILFWLTPILYPATLVEEKGPVWVRTLIMGYNPLSDMVELSRHAVFGSRIIVPADFMGLGMVSFSALGLGILMFRKLRPGFADVL